MQENKSYDIGLVCMANANRGNNLTNYALYQYLTDLDYRVLFISNPLKVSVCFPNAEDDRFFQFEVVPYSEEDIWKPERNKWGMSGVNAMCGCFVLGSDQLWRSMFIEETDYFTCLDWAESGKYKIAYATSFGTDQFEGNAQMREKAGYLLRRFQRISVREPGGARLLKELYGIDSEYVLDPVFLCSKAYFRKMAERGRAHLPQTSYTGAYLLDMTVEQENMVQQIAANVSGGVYRAITDSDGSLSLAGNPSIEEWLAMIEGCEFLITDSFHGLCFALIFEKPFCVVFNKENWRGFDRIRSLLELLQLSSRLMERCDTEKAIDLYRKPVGYQKVNEILSAKRESSKRWLNASLEEGKRYKGRYDIHDFVWELSGNLNRELEDMREAFLRTLQKTRNDLFMLSRLSEMAPVNDRSFWKPEGKAETMQMIGWGAGACFRRNIPRIKRFYDMKYVCDRDPEKWGQKLDGQVVCISPQMLSEMQNRMVVIMADRADYAVEIARELSEMGIRNFEHVEKWLSFVEGE